MTKQPQATMTTIQGRPTPVLHRLSSLDDALVQCRIESGEDVYVPLREIYELFGKQLAQEIQMQGMRENKI